MDNLYFNLIIELQNIQMNGGFVGQFLDTKIFSLCWITEHDRMIVTFLSMLFKYNSYLIPDNNFNYNEKKQ